MPSISVERTVGKTKKAVLDGLIRYNNEKMGKQKYKRLAISLRVGDKIVGGSVGEVWTAVLFVQLFWMEQKFRGKGFGKKLIKAIEDEAKRIGATRAYLDTMSMQAPGFYRGCGYREFGDRRLPQRRYTPLVHERAMTTSNSKFRSTKEAPTEPFKRAVTSCLRAIAKTPELEVTFAAERPGLAPGKARLPEPARKMTKRDAAIVRGHADSIALKLACHDPKVHRKLMPGNPQARGVFEAVEQARVEAIGSRRMAGVAKNLTAMLDDHFHRGKFDEITDRADAPLSDALAMLVRERLTGLAPPAAARKMVDLWRPVL